MFVNFYLKYVNNVLIDEAYRSIFFTVLPLIFKFRYAKTYYIFYSEKIFMYDLLF